jgi:hypothetical protein
MGNGFRAPATWHLEERSPSTIRKSVHSVTVFMSVSGELLGSAFRGLAAVHFKILFQNFSGGVEEKNNVFELLFELRNSVQQSGSTPYYNVSLFIA